MRIIGGKWKRRRLEGSFELEKQNIIRPTSDRVKENIFNIIENLKTGNPLLGARVLDLFCGTGSMGLEALSRGSCFCHFIDNYVGSKRITLNNITKFGVENHSKFTLADVLQLKNSDDLMSNIVFLDPPYGRNLGEKTIKVLLKNGWVNEGAIFILEKEIERKLSCNLKIIDQRKYGKTEINILTN